MGKNAVPDQPKLGENPVSEGLSRRGFLGSLFGSALTLATAGFAERALAQTLPSYDSMTTALKQRGLHLSVGETLAGDGDFKEFDIVKVGFDGKALLDANGKKQIVARMITLEETGNGYFDQIICDGDSPKSFAEMAKRYENENPGTELILQVAGTFSCKGSSCQSSNSRDYEPDGKTFHRGKSVGWTDPNTKYGGVVVLGPNGKPQVLSKDAFDPSHLGNRDAFQTFTVVENGQPQNFKSEDRCSRRALVERFFTDSSGKLQSAWAIVNCDEKMSQTEFGQFLFECLGVRNAALLDTGGWSTGWIKYKETTGSLLPNEDEPPPNFTSLLVAVSRK